MALVLLATGAAYSPVFFSGFVSFDDAVYVIDNSNIKGGFSFESIRWAFLTTTDGNWFPLTWLSYMLDISVAGFSSRTIHVSNLIYHLANSALLCGAIYYLTGAVYRSVLVAALFALHPLHVESVAWVSERKDLVSTLFFLLTIIAYIRFQKQRSLVRYLLTLLLFACGLMAKSMLVSLPLLLLLLDFWPLKKFVSLTGREFRLLFLEKLPFFALSVASSVITYNVQKHKAVVKFDDSPLLINMANAAISYVKYLYKTFVPHKLAVLYPFEADISFVAAGGAALFLLVVSVWVFIHRTKRPYALVGWYWYLISLVPVIGIIRVGKQAMADRYTYIPHIGFFILLVWSLAEWAPLKKIGDRAKVTVIVTCFTVLALLTWQQSRYWRTSIELFSRTVDVTENNWVALGVLGYDYITRNKLDKALVLLNKSLALNPNNTMALYNMGILQNKLGNRGVALQQFEKVVAIEPDYKMAHFQIGLQLLYSGDTVGALDKHKELEGMDQNLARQLFSAILVKNYSGSAPH